ncbi:MAG: serine hydrolase [Vibrio sp.]
MACMALVPTFSFSALTVIPELPPLAANGYILIDFHTGKVLVEHNAHQKLNPASLTKLMTAYVAGQEMQRGNIQASDQVRISNNAWAKKFPDSSKMFIEVGTYVSLMDLYRGLIVQSGNDASVAIAEHVAGSQGAFVSLMNSWAQQLGMHNSQFANPHGLDNPNLYSTPYDIAVLSRAIIRDLPDIYPLYSERSFTYNGITQHNRNGLLRDRSINVDGMKTGYTSGAGYSLASSATHGEMRLIAVVMGAKSVKIREAESKQLLGYGFRFFETVSPHQIDHVVQNQRIWYGEQDHVALGSAETVYLTFPRRDIQKLNAVIELDRTLEAPIGKGEVVGSIVYYIDQDKVGEAQLVTQQAITQGGIFKRMSDWFKLLFSNWF